MWALQNTRKNLLKTLENLTAEALDSQPVHGNNTIGSLLYHIADSEAYWIYASVLRRAMDPEIVALFSHQEPRDEGGTLIRPQGSSLNEHLQRLSTIRERLLKAYTGLTLEEFRRAHRLSDEMGTADVSAERVLYHLMQHETEHRGHIQTIIEGLG